MMITVLDYLENTARDFPDKTAFADLEREISFHELVDEAKSVATAISGQAGPRRPVLVCMEKGTCCISAFLGTVYAGGFYVPVDSQMPLERVRMITDCLKPGLVLYDRKSAGMAGSLPEGIRHMCYEDAASCSADDGILQQIRNGMKGTDLLYVLFTSGSTGVPKGVTVSHAAVMDFMEWVCGRYRLDESAVLCSQAPFYFDASVPDIFIPVKTGATAYIPPKSYYTFPKKILQYVEEHAVNTLFWVPSALCNVVNLHAFDVCVPHSIRLVIFCGEVMPCRQLNVWRKHIPDAQYVNMYGPTEAAYACMYFDIERDFADDDRLPLGKACENSRILLLKKDGMEAGNGETGEICILGQCLSQGYYRDWEKTREVFVQNPLNPHWMEIMYRTGDLAYVDENGEIFFAGRKDFQIKRLGHRIELGEIEHAIRSVEGVENACCLFDEETGEITAVFSGWKGEGAVSRAAAEKLPRYMVPNRYIRLEQMPVNLNGKTDRAGLWKKYVKGFPYNDNGKIDRTFLKEDYINKNGES